MPVLSLEELSVLLEGSSVAFDEEISQFYQDRDFSYQYFSAQEKDKIILDILEYIRKDQVVVATPEREKVWDKGWRENLDSFLQHRNIDSLLPRFIKPTNVIRLQQDYVRPTNPYFERDFCLLLQQWLFKRYMTDFEAVYEFGCGSGFNLVTIARLFPKIKIFGGDFVPSSLRLVDEIAHCYGYNMSSFHFDMTKPDFKMQMLDNSCILTFCSIEQINNRFQDFIYFLLNKKPALCIHVEPVFELYYLQHLPRLLIVLQIYLL